MWELAKSPMRSLFMTGFLLWMSGSGVNIFPIIITVMSIVTPMKTIFATNDTFRPFEREGLSTTLAKIVYILLNAVVLCAALFKCHSMGLLPNATDLIDSVPRQSTDFSAQILALGT